MEFITQGNRIAVENFEKGKLYTILWKNDTQENLMCISIGADCVVFQGEAPINLFTLSMRNADTIDSIEPTQLGTTNYNNLINKPQINGVDLIGNKTGTQLGLVSQADLEDYATNASVIAALATKQDALSSSQLSAVNSGITSELVTQIGTNETNILMLQQTSAILATEQGSLDYRTGNEITATNRVRSASPIYVGDIYDNAVCAATGYVLIPRIYSADGTYIVGGNDTTEVTYSYLTDSTNYENTAWYLLSASEKYIITNGLGKVRFIVKKSDNTDITPADVVLTYTYKNTAYQTVKAITDFAEIDNGTLVCKKGVYHITEPITIDISQIKKIDGNGAIFVVESDINAFVIQGSMTVSSASPITMPAAVYPEMNTIIDNLVITSLSGDSGTGLKIEKTVGLIIRNCLLRNLKNGIVISDINRNMIISNNNIYACANDGILYDSTCNLHQCIINSNHISYCTKCININNALQIANFQIIGNDIEIGDYPTATKASAKCISITINGSTVFSGEIVMTGNTVQGHGYSPSIISINGYNSSKTIDNVSICGNHISNTSDVIYDISNVKSVSISGNNYKDVGGYIVQLSDNCSYISVTAETGFSVTSGIIHALSTATITGLVSVGCACNAMSSSIDTADKTDVRLMDT